MNGGRGAAGLGSGRRGGGSSSAYCAFFRAVTLRAAGQVERSPFPRLGRHVDDLPARSKHLSSSHAMSPTLLAHGARVVCLCAKF